MTIRGFVSVHGIDERTRDSGRLSRFRSAEASAGPPLMVRIWTIFSPFLPATLAQSSGFVVFGQIFVFFEFLPDGPDQVLRAQAGPFLAIARLTANFFARDTMPSINAPLAKSLKYSTSFSPLA